MRDYIALIIVTLILFTMMSFQVQFFSTFEHVTNRSQAASLATVLQIEIWEAVMKTLTSTNLLDSTGDFISYQIEITNVETSLPTEIQIAASTLSIVILGSGNEVYQTELPSTAWGRTIVYAPVSFGNVNQLTVTATLTSSDTVTISLVV